LTDPADEKLVARCKKGQKDAYALLVKRHYRDVFALCLGLLGNVDDAEDIAQDAMLRGFLKIKKLRDNRQFEPWILQIAKNLCIDLLRRRKHVKAILAAHPALSSAGNSENHELQQLIRQLPLELRLPLVMYYFDGRNAKSIAEKLRISHSGACRRIRDARKQLHELFQERRGQ